MSTAQSRWRTWWRSPERAVRRELAAPAIFAATLLLGGCGGTLAAGDYALRTVEATNTVRAENDLPPLAISECATLMAFERASSLVGSSALEHAPMGPVAATCAVTITGENLSRSDRSPQDVVDAWMESPGHASNVLDSDYTEVGVACVDDAGEMLCSQVFLAP